MMTPAEMTERHAAVLARLAGVAEQLAMKHAERALGADDPEVEAKATAAFHRAARAVRQCLAPEAKLVRDAARADREDRDDATREATVRRDRHREHVRMTAKHLIWLEAERESLAERYEARLEDLLDLEELSEGFADEPVEAHVARLCRRMGLIPDDEPAEMAAEPAPGFGDVASPERRSSA